MYAGAYRSLIRSALRYCSSAFAASPLCRYASAAL